MSRGGRLRVPVPRWYPLRPKTLPPTNRRSQPKPKCLQQTKPPRHPFVTRETRSPHRRDPNTYGTADGRVVRSATEQPLRPISRHRNRHVLWNPISAANNRSTPLPQFGRVIQRLQREWTAAVLRLPHQHCRRHRTSSPAPHLLQSPRLLYRASKLRNRERPLAEARP